MKIGVVKETLPGEKRVALVPSVTAVLIKASHQVLIQSTAGQEGGFLDEQYSCQGAEVLSDRREVFAQADIILQVQGLGANPEEGKEDLALMRAGQVVIAMLDPLWRAKEIEELAKRQVTAFAMELMPRITRAQTMDVLSSMATLAGYKAVLLGANCLARMCPMMTTAAGTITPTKVFVIGAGVAGLQAIATARRLGAVVRGYDVRAAVKEQVESLGARFVEVELETKETEDKGGYAKSQDEQFYRKQRELLCAVVSESDMVITTAMVPASKAPILITADMVAKMSPGAVIVDLAAPRGGNCELTKPDETVVQNGVTILGPTNLPAELAYNASQMYAKNISAFLLNMIKDGTLQLDMADEIISETLVTQNGKVVHPKILELLEKPKGE